MNPVAFQFTEDMRGFASAGQSSFDDGYAAGRDSDSSTRKRSESPESLASLTAARTRLPKCVSIHSRVKLFGTATTSSPFEIATARASPNHVR